MTGQATFPKGSRGRILYLVSEAMAALDAHSYNSRPKDMPMGLRDFAARLNTAGLQVGYQTKARARELEALFRGVEAESGGCGEAGGDPDRGSGGSQ